MPLCEVSKYQAGEDALRNNGIKIFYRIFGRGKIKVLMIIGLAGTHESWGPQIKGLAGNVRPNDEDWPDVDRSSDDGVQICAFDNRGMGRSSVPTKKSDYTTRMMASDAIAVLDHLGWRKAHVFGHSMGAMIACKFAAMVPDRVQSLALLNVTGGGFECFPKYDCQTLSVAIRFLKAKTPEQRAAVDLDTHYTKEYLEEFVETKTRRQILYQIDKFGIPFKELLSRSLVPNAEEYVKEISASGMQSNYGFDGQINACWTHKMSRIELELIRSSQFLISVIHGRHDIIAQLCHARNLALKLWPLARIEELHGGHLVSHERPEEVNQALRELIKASESKFSPHDWTNMPEKNPSWVSTLISSRRTDNEGGNNSSFVYEAAQKLNIMILYIFSLFVLTFAYSRRALRCLKPVRVGTSLTLSS